MMKRRKGIGIGILLLLLWIMIMYDSFQTEYFFRCVILFFMIGALLAVRQLSKMTVQFDENEDEWIQEGLAKRTLILKNAGHLPFSKVEVFVKITDSSGNKEERTLFINGKGREERRFEIPMQVHHSGIVEIVAESMRIWDFVGFFSWKKKLHVQTAVYIFPENEKNLKFAMTQSGYAQMSNDNDEVVWGVEGDNHSEIFEVDVYREGSDIRNIHWKLSSKSEEFMIKKYAHSVHKELAIFVDLAMQQEYRFTGCDFMVSVVRSLIQFCEESRIPYRLFLCGKDGAKEAEWKEIFGNIEIFSEPVCRYFEIFRYHNSERKVFLTTNELSNHNSREHHHIVRLPYKQKDEKIYELSTNMIFQLEINKECGEIPAQILTVESDQTRVHRKSSNEKPVSYVLFMHLLAFLATSVAALSLMDLLIVQEPVIPVFVMCAICMMPGFLLYFFAEPFWEMEKITKIRNRMLIAGYGVIILLGKGSFLVEGIKTVVQLLQSELVFEGNQYGFLVQCDTELWWLVFFVIYSICDVLYHFSVQFSLKVHLLIVVPLVSIPFLFGAVPSFVILVTAAIYLVLLFVVFQAHSHGKGRKKYALSDDFQETDNITVQSGMICSGIMSVIMILLASFFLVFGYQRAMWQDHAKQEINLVVEGRFAEVWNRLKQDMQYGSTLRNTERGSLQNLSEVHYSGEKVLEVTIDGSVEYPLYLKSFVGDKYDEDRWKTRSDAACKMEEFQLWTELEKNTAVLKNNGKYRNAKLLKADLSYQLASYRESGQYVVSEDYLNKAQISIKTFLEDDTNLYIPYFSEKSYAEDSNVKLAEGYAFTYENIERKEDVFTVCQLPDILGMERMKARYGAYPYVSENGRENQELQDLITAEKLYAKYVRENYLEVPKQLKSLQEEFSQAKLDAGGRAVQVNPEEVNLEIGYEPYVEYVCNYFKNGFTYTLSPGQDTSKDFIVDFLERKSGFCVHFASAAVYMFRSMGIPARYAEGYCIETQPSYSGSIVVKDEESHAWVEIYQEGIGWIPVEVTIAAGGSSGEENTGGQIQTSMSSGEAKPQESNSSSQGMEIEIHTTKEMGNNSSPLEQEPLFFGETSENQTDRGVEISTEFLVVLGLLGCFAWAVAASKVYAGSNRKKMERQTSEREIQELERQFYTALEVFHIKLPSSVDNMEKADILCGKLRENQVSAEELHQLLEIFDKKHYSRELEISDEETAFAKKVALWYMNACYQEAKLLLRWKYRYFKGLYFVKKKKPE